ncbi:MAG: TetR family transcriptional regulator [Mesorhizobium amorphae]|nr:MAG: TetR family transcriptional regulator [Mesorhizobium amorphae]
MNDETTGLKVGRVPTQARARKRVETILHEATGMIAAHGLDALRMSELAQRAGIPIGSLYQYFPDKAAVVAQLSMRLNDEGRRCVADELTPVRTEKELFAAIGEIADRFYAMYVEQPAMKAVWQATQASPVLQELDAKDGIEHSKLLSQAMTRVYPRADSHKLFALSALLMTQLAAAVRFAITLDDGDARMVLDMFKSLMLPRKIEALDRS